MTPSKSDAVAVDAEDAKLSNLGYKPQFERVLGLFGDFSLVL